ncbi:MAG TPA: DNA polymerase Y family protein, partial [Thermoanaerobaculia bacterium]|nr:DNA polymerase Y family protein [Thermoanaerobaculia bacterium]
MSSRVACIVVPLFPLAARLRSEPDLVREAVAVFEGNGNAARVVAATRPARRAGIQPGMTLPQARALLPDLLARGRDRESERAAQEALAEVAETFSPRVESAGDGVVYFDAVGIPLLDRGVREAKTPPQVLPLPPGEDSSLLPSLPATEEKVGVRGDSTELRLGRDVISSVERTGLPARFGIAASKLAARVAAGLPDSPTVVPEGEEARFLAPLPLGKLAPEMEIAETLDRWGIRSIGDLAKLPEGEVASRLGEMGRELHATARGVDPRPLEPRLPPPSLSEGMELEWPLVSLEPFLFVGNAALERLVRRLESQALACRRLEVALKLDPEGWDARAITLPAPTRDTRTLLTLVRLELEARPPGAPVVGFTFTAQPDRPRQAQLSLFGPAAISPDRLATTIARLVALLGADRVGSPRAVDGHRPERFAVADYSPPPPPRERRAPRTGRGLLAIRVLRPPVELEVITEEANPLSPPRGERVGVRGLRLLSLKSANGSSPEISGTVRVAAGPWNLEEGWWSAAPASRDYWDVELAQGGLYRIYRDRAGDKWYA